MTPDFIDLLPVNPMGKSHSIAPVVARVIQALSLQAQKGLFHLIRISPQMLLGCDKRYADPLKSNARPA